MSDNKNKKEPELADIAADFVRDKNKRQKIFNGIGYAADAAVKLLTGVVYIGSAVWNFGEKIAPSIKSGVAKALDFGARNTATWRGHIANNFSENDEFGNSKFKWPTGIKQWHQVATKPTLFAGAFAIVYAVTAAVIDFPGVWLADSKRDPIYKVTKPLEKDSGWQVECEFIADKDEQDANCSFNLPDNGYLDLTYRLKSVQLNLFKTVSGVWSGYSPKAHVAKTMRDQDSQYCAINTTYEEPMLGAESYLPSIYRSPICHPDLDKLVEILENDHLSSSGEIMRKAGKVEKESDGAMFYRPADEASWLSGAFAWVFVQGGETIDSVGDTIGGWVDSAFESDEETPAEAEDQENENNDANGKTSMIEFNNATYINDNYNQSDMIVNVSIEKTALPAMKIA